MSYKAANLPAEKHCFFGCHGGVSQGVYASLNFNFSSDDSRENLFKNIEIATGKFGLRPENLLLMHQDVSSHVEYVTQASIKEITADGAVTDRPGIMLGISTADCAPVLLADYKHGVIGASHAGWRGAFKGVIENTIELMIAKGARREDICAAVGPCIGQPSYEVDSRFYQQFFDKNQGFSKYFKPGGRESFYQFNLEAFCYDRLKDCGIGSISVSGLDTCALEKDYFSFRRNTLRGLIKGGPKNFPVELSTIVL